MTSPNEEFGSLSLVIGGTLAVCIPWCLIWGFAVLCRRLRLANNEDSVEKKIRQIAEKRQRLIEWFIQQNVIMVRTMLCFFRLSDFI